MDINLQPIAQKIEDLIKAYLKDNGHYKSGKLYNSIKVTVDDTGNYSINTLDYFQFLDDKFDIIATVFAMQELIDTIEKTYFNAFDQL